MYFRVKNTLKNNRNHSFKYKKIWVFHLSNRVCQMCQMFSQINIDKKNLETNIVLIEILLEIKLY